MSADDDWLRSVTAEQLRSVTRAVDPSVAHIARVQDYWLGLELAEPGVVRCPEWRPDRPQDAAGKSTMWGGVARKPTEPVPRQLL